MKLLLVLTPTERLEDVQAVIDEHHVHAYTEVPDVRGSGRRGRKMGTRAFPGTSSILLTVLEDEEADRLGEALREECGDPGESPVRVFAMPAEAVL